MCVWRWGRVVRQAWAKASRNFGEKATAWTKAKSRWGGSGNRCKNVRKRETWPRASVSARKGREIGCLCMFLKGTALM